MEQHDLPQGSPEWHAHRACCNNASDAAAMLGCSPYKTRTQLLHELHTGLAREFSDYVQGRVIDSGHRTEALARPLGERILGEDLFPVVGTLRVAPLTRALSASFDGITMAEDAAWECKSLNDELRAAMPIQGPDGNDAAKLGKMYRVQMEQQCAVSGAERVLFTASNGQDDDRHCWYYPDPVLRAEIIAGWAQFEKDLAAYVPPTTSNVEKLVAEPVEALPAPVVQVSGTLALTDNFKVFEERLRDFLANKLIKAPKVDQDFVDLDLQIKAMKQGREALKGAKAQMLGQVQPIDQAAKTADMLDKMLQQACSAAETMLTAEKERRKGEIVAGGVSALKQHIDSLNARLGKPYMPTVPADFGGCIKGLKSLSSMEDKVATELARAKIAANEVADRIQINLATLVELASEHKFLFSDTGALVLKAADDCRAVVSARIAEHTAEQARKEQETRERIAKEEREKLEREQREREAEAARVAAAAELAAAKAKPEGAELSPDAQALNEKEGEARFAAVHPAAKVVPIVQATAPSSPPSLKLGQISERLGFTVTADFLGKLGFAPAATDKSARLYHEADFNRMCDSLVAHIRTAQQQARAA